MKIGIDLLWVRPGICGGTESFIRNLMDGFALYDKKNEYLLFASQDNEESFSKYLKYPNMSVISCPVKSAGRLRRIMWENARLDREAARAGAEVMFIPVYSKPVTRGSKIPYVSVIHDLQALHYPDNFSFLKRMFLKHKWRYVCRTSDQVVTISDYCRQDLIKHYPFVKNKIQTIYNPIKTVRSGLSSDVLQESYGIQKGDYYYCVSSMLPHKNLITVLKVIAELKRRGRKATLVISGVGGEKEMFQEAVRELEIEDEVIQTGFVSDELRDCLYENCSLFLFPSIFEGFGMPPVEAMRKGKNVVMTKGSCLYEVTEGKAVYVEDPFGVEEWIKKIDIALSQPARAEAFEKYRLQTVVEQYVMVLTGVRKIRERQSERKIDR